MMKKSLALVATLFLSANVHAAPLTWTVDAVGDLGQIVAGTFDYDASLCGNSGACVTALDIHVSGGSNPLATTADYTIADKTLSGTYDLALNTPNANISDVLLLLSWPIGGPNFSVLTDAGGTYALDTTGGGASRMVWINNNVLIGESFITSGTVSASPVVPAPSALLLMASGLVGLVAIRRWTGRNGSA